MTLHPGQPTLDSTPSASMISDWRGLAQHCLSLALRFDYLSGRRGPQKPRQAVRDRLAKNAKPIPVSREPGARMARGTREETRFASDDSEHRYLADIAAKPRLTSREEYCLVARLRAGDRKAYDGLIEGNLGLVVMFARRYQRPGVPLLDLIAEGNLGLMQAVARFDPERGYRFATYAKWWVLQSIQQAMPKLAGVVRIPLAHRSAVPGTVTAEAHDEPEADRVVVQDHAADSSPPEEPEAASAPGAGERFEIGDADVLASIPIDPAQEPPATAMAAQRLRVLQQALDTLGERERFIVSARFGLDEDRVWTLDALATRFVVSIERIRQIEGAAVKNLEKALRRAGESADSLL